MAVIVRVPAPLQKLTQNQAEVKATGANIRELIDDLERAFPGIKARFYNEAGSLNRFINIYVNEEDIRFLKNEDTPLKDVDIVTIVPAIAGGGRKY